MQGFIQQVGSRYVSVVLFKDGGKEKTQTKIALNSTLAAEQLQKMMSASLHERVLKYINHRERVMRITQVHDQRYALVLQLQTELKRLPVQGLGRLVNWLLLHSEHLYRIAPGHQSVYYQHDQQVLAEIIEDAQAYLDQRQQQMA